MKRFIALVLAATVFGSVSLDSLYGQPRSRFPRATGRMPPKKPKQPTFPPLPTDQRLLDLHLQFVKKAETLAQEYERTKQFSKALDVYTEVLKLVPQYPPARARAEELRKMEAMANKATFVVQANLGWQDTGIMVLAGKPITIRAAGNWTFNLSSEMGPDGMTVPKELQDFKFGSLVGAIHSGDLKSAKPFVVGAEKSLVGEKKGKLYLRMYDVDPKDNKGSIQVMFFGTFEKD